MISQTMRTLIVGSLVFSISLVIPNKALAAPSLELNGGTVWTDCINGNCFTNRHFCTNPTRGDFHLTVTGAAADSTVTLRLFWFNVYWLLQSETEIGSTDSEGYFDTTMDPPPGSGTHGAFMVDVVIAGEGSNYQEYRNNVDGAACS